MPLVVLGAAIVAETFSFRTAIIEANKARGKQSMSRFLKGAKAPELPVILLEDLAALLGLIFALFGVGLALLTDNGLWDVVGAAMIGVLLVAVAVTLAIETKSLLLGEAAGTEAVHRIEDSITGTEGVTRLIHMKTLHLGPEEILVAAKIGVDQGAQADEVAATINRRTGSPGGRADGDRALPGAGHLRPRLRVPADQPERPAPAGH